MGDIVCIKCGRTDADRPCGKYCGDGSDKDNPHDWRTPSTLTADASARASKARNRRISLEAEAAERAEGRARAAAERDTELRTEGAAAERAAVVAYLNRRTEGRGLFQSVAAIVEELERGEHLKPVGG